MHNSQVVQAIHRSSCGYCIYIGPLLLAPSDLLALWYTCFFMLQILLFRCVSICIKTRLDKHDFCIFFRSDFSAFTFPRMVTMIKAHLLRCLCYPFHHILAPPSLSALIFCTIILIFKLSLVDVVNTPMFGVYNFLLWSADSNKLNGNCWTLN